MALTTPPKKSPERNGFVQPKSPAAPSPARAIQDEYNTGQYNALVQQLLALSEHSEGEGIVIGITGDSIRADASTTALNLALNASHSLSETLILDTPSLDSKLSRQMGAERLPGWTDVLCGTSDLFDCLLPTTAENLTFLPSGTLSGKQTVLPSPATVTTLLEMLKDRFSLVIVDLPITERIGSSSQLVSQLDGVLLVVDAQKGTERSFQHSKKQLELAQAKLLGAIINRQKNFLPTWLGGNA